MVSSRESSQVSTKDGPPSASIHSATTTRAVSSALSDKSRQTQRSSQKAQKTMTSAKPVVSPLRPLLHLSRGSSLEPAMTIKYFEKKLSDEKPMPFDLPKDVDIGRSRSQQRSVSFTLPPLTQRQISRSISDLILRKADTFVRINKGMPRSLTVLIETLTPASRREVDHAYVKLPGEKHTCRGYP